MGLAKAGRWTRLPGAGLFPSKDRLFNAVMDGLGGRLESGGPHPLQEGLPPSVAILVYEHRLVSPKDLSRLNVLVG